MKNYLNLEDLPFGGHQEKLIAAFSPLVSYFQAFTVTVNGDVYLVFGPKEGEPSPAS